MIQRIEPFPQNDSKFLFFGFDSELIFWLWLLEWYCFVYYDSNKPFFSNTTQRIELFLLIDMTQRIVFPHMSHRIEHFFEHERIEPSSFFMTQRIELFLKIIWLQDLKTFVNREMELFEFGSRNFGLFNNITQKWLTLLGHDSQSWTFFQHDSQNWTFLKNMIHRDWTLLYNMTRKWVHFLVWLQEYFYFTKCMTQLKLIVFGKYDSKNWNFWKKGL